MAFAAQLYSLIYLRLALLPETLPMHRQADRLIHSHRQNTVQRHRLRLIHFVKIVQKVGRIRFVVGQIGLVVGVVILHRLTQNHASRALIWFVERYLMLRIRGIV